MICRKIDANGDWNFGKGMSDMARDQKAIEQDINTRLLSWVGDCFFALNDGIDWKNRLDVGGQKDLEDEVRFLILRTDGVVGINSLVVEFDETTRRIRITYDVETIFGQSFQSTISQGTGS
jgi:hypothetical protein